MPESERTADNRAPDGGQTSHDRREDPPPAEESVERVAASTLRIGLAILGLIIVLFAVGQAVGLELLELVVEALGTEVGRWLTVAFFGLILIVVALRGFGR